MPGKADLPEVLRVLVVLLRRLSDGERLPLASVKLVRQCVAELGELELDIIESYMAQKPMLRDAVSSPAEDPDGAH